jgi:hypothetical protein
MRCRKYGHFIVDTRRASLDAFFDGGIDPRPTKLLALTATAQASGAWCWQRSQ